MKKRPPNIGRDPNRGVDGRSGRPIYLAGPVDDADDPTAWRDDLKESYPDLDFVDPVEVWPDYADDPKETISWCLEKAERCDVLAGMLGAADTTGTHHEIDRAVVHGRRVVAHIHDPAAVSKFVLEHPSIEITYDLEQAIQILAEREATP